MSDKDSKKCLLSKRQIKILKMIKKKPMTPEEISLKLKIDSKADDIYIITTGEFDDYVKQVDSNPLVITTSENGSSALEGLRKDIFRFWFPTIISIIALISSVVGWFFPK